MFTYSIAAMRLNNEADTTPTVRPVDRLPKRFEIFLGLGDCTVIGNGVSDLIGKNITPVKHQPNQ